jgi:hypothetical protein
VKVAVAVTGVLTDFVARPVTELDQLENLIDLAATCVATIKRRQELEVGPPGEVWVKPRLLDETGQGGGPRLDVPTSTRTMTNAA